jgi:hypothetical protein
MPIIIQKRQPAKDLACVEVEEEWEEAQVKVKDVVDKGSINAPVALFLEYHF